MKKDGKVISFLGVEYDVIREDGRYFYCDGLQVRKLNRNISRVKQKERIREKEGASVEHDE